jgi:hypothetical protein
MPSPTPLCAVFEPQVALLSAGVLDAEQVESVHEHLAGCAYCQLQLREYQRLREDLLRLLLGGATAGVPGDARPAPAIANGDAGSRLDQPTRFTLEQIMRASAETPLDTSPPQGYTPRMLNMPPQRQLLSALGAIAAVLVLALLAASVFGALRLPSGPAGQATPTNYPFAPYLAAAPGLPCDTNAQASALWSGDEGICLTGPARTRLVSRGNLLAIMRWDAGAHHLPDNYKISVQVTLAGASTARLQIANGQSLGHRIACSPNHCEVDGISSEACACNTSGPLTLAIVVRGKIESFYAGNTLLGSATQSAAFHPTSISLGVSASNPSAQAEQGAQADFANFAVVAS